VGKATENILEKLKGWGLGVSVSLGCVGEAHEAVRGVEGCYRLVLAILERLSNLRVDNPVLRISVGITISVENSDEIVEVTRATIGWGSSLLRRRGLDVPRPIRGRLPLHLHGGEAWQRQGVYARSGIVLYGGYECPGEDQGWKMPWVLGRIRGL